MSLYMYKFNTIDFYTASNEFSLQQDTIKNKVNTTLAQDTIVNRKIQTINFSEADSILRKSEERELQIQAQIQEQLQRDAAIQRWLRKQNDTSEILYKEFGIAKFPIEESLENDLTQQNVFYNFLSVKPEEKQESNLVFLESETKENSKANTTSQTGRFTSEPKEIPNRIQFDWITILLIGSMLLIGWVQLFNKKYLTSLFKSIFSVQESTTMYREKNSNMEKASFMVNLLFLSNIAVFITQLSFYYEYEIGGIENYIFYFILLGLFFCIYMFRLITSWLIGFVFLKQKTFSEFFHNANIYTKSIGVFLLPIVISLQFLLYEYLSFIIFIGLAVIALLYLIHIVRAFQIIIRKNVSISYMILYLCAFEFAPFLIIYKIVLSYVG